MTVDFNYGNSIDAGTPAVASEVQENFDDVLAWIKSYFQQSAETTAEIAAAITTYRNGQILDSATQSASVVFTGGSYVAIPDMEVSWTATASNLYRIDIANVNIQIPATDGILCTLAARATSSGTPELIQTVSVSDSTRATLWVLGGSAFITGISGAASYSAFLRQSLLVGASGSANATLYAPSGGATGKMYVTDLGQVS